FRVFIQEGASEVRLRWDSERLIELACVGLFVESAGSLDRKFATCEHGIVERIEKLPHEQPLFVWRLQ
ncbi:MAG: hypothetical protein VX607_08695, partial [Planctomycetota bacterium]|nr:hypothetical protein [Planctomycetota bacterium]